MIRIQTTYKLFVFIFLQLKPNTCPYCDSSFSQKVTLDNHIRGVHSKRKNILNCVIKGYKSYTNSH